MTKYKEILAEFKKWYPHADIDIVKPCFNCKHYNVYCERGFDRSDKTQLKYVVEIKNVKVDAISYNHTMNLDQTEIDEAFNNPNPFIDKEEIESYNYKGIRIFEVIRETQVEIEAPWSDLIEPTAMDLESTAYCPSIFVRWIKLAKMDWHTFKNRIESRKFIDEQKKFLDHCQHLYKIAMKKTRIKGLKSP